MKASRRNILGYAVAVFALLAFHSISIAKNNTTKRITCTPEFINTSVEGSNVFKCPDNPGEPACEPFSNDLSALTKSESSYSIVDRKDNTGITLTISRDSGRYTLLYSYGNGERWVRQTGLCEITTKRKF